MQRAAVLAVVCALSAGAKSEPVAETFALPRREERGLNVFVSGVAIPDHARISSGFLLGGAYEFPVAPGVDLNFGTSFERFGSANGPATVVSLLDVTASRRAPTTIFFGAGLGPIFDLGNVRPAARMFGGAELFHQGAVPIHVALELIMKFCDDTSLRCPSGEKQTWLAGRIGLRL